MEHTIVPVTYTDSTLPGRGAHFIYHNICKCSSERERVNVSVIYFHSVFLKPADIQTIGEQAHFRWENHNSFPYGINVYSAISSLLQS